MRIEDTAIDFLLSELRGYLITVQCDFIPDLCRLQKSLASMVVKSMTMCALRNVIILSMILAVFPSAVFADDDHSIEFIVKDGDNLYDICEKILENPEDWRWVAMVNRIKNPHRIFPGQKLIIPTRLLKGIPIDGLVTFVKGVASIKLAEAEEWKDLQLNDKITQGNWIRTSPQGTIEISFENHFSVLLRPNTNIEITSAQKKSDI